jgi:hypothetical protein
LLIEQASADFSANGITIVAKVLPLEDLANKFVENLFSFGIGEFANALRAGFDFIHNVFGIEFLGRQILEILERLIEHIWPPNF